MWILLFEHFFLAQKTWDSFIWCSNISRQLGLGRNKENSKGGKDRHWQHVLTKIAKHRLWDHFRLRCWERKIRGGVAAWNGLWGTNSEFSQWGILRSRPTEVFHRGGWRSPANRAPYDEDEREAGNMDESTSKKSISYFDYCKTFGAVGTNFFKGKYLMLTAIMGLRLIHDSRIYISSWNHSTNLSQIRSSLRKLE